MSEGTFCRVEVHIYMHLILCATDRAIAERLHMISNEYPSVIHSLGVTFALKHRSPILATGKIMPLYVTWSMCFMLHFVFYCYDEVM